MPWQALGFYNQWQVRVWSSRFRQNLKVTSYLKIWNWKLKKLTWKWKKCYRNPKNIKNIKNTKKYWEYRSGEEGLGKPLATWSTWSQIWLQTPYDVVADCLLLLLAPYITDVLFVWKTAQLVWTDNSRYDYIFTWFMFLFLFRWYVIIRTPVKATSAISFAVIRMCDMTEKQPNKFCNRK